jgi:hypothetical protein
MRGSTPIPRKISNQTIVISANIETIQNNVGHQYAGDHPEPHGAHLGISPNLPAMPLLAIRLFVAHNESVRTEGLGLPLDT